MQLRQSEKLENEKCLNYVNRNVNVIILSTSSILIFCLAFPDISHSHFLSVRRYFPFICVKMNNVILVFQLFYHADSGGRTCSKNLLSVFLLCALR